MLSELQQIENPSMTPAVGEGSVDLAGPFADLWRSFRELVEIGLSAIAYGRRTPNLSASTKFSSVPFCVFSSRNFHAFEAVSISFNYDSMMVS